MSFWLELPGEAPGFFFEVFEGEAGAEGEDLGFGEGAEGAGESMRWEEAWTERSWATRSEESFAAFTARVRGIMRRVWANSPMASCSRDP